MQHFLQSWGYSAVFVLALVEAICIPFPSEITFGFAGALAAEGRFDLAAVIGVGLAGEFIGSMIGYTLGRTGGRALVDRYGKYVLVSNSDVDRAHRFLERRGDSAVALGRVLPVVRTFVSLVAGIGEMAMVPFALFTLIGTAVYSSAVAAAGYALGSRWHSLVRGFTDASYVVLALVVLAIVGYVWHRWRRVRSRH
ncbi:MAG TPA: DedA family protein [Acidimicrobiales bacterium]|nr:DedA family protein [Acidimicrobiales bacterium]